MRKTVITLIFIALLCAPAAALVLGERTLFRENPTLTKLPAIRGSSFLDRDFYRAVEDYIDKRNPFREELIRTKAWIDVRLFRSSSAPDVHMGRDGWRYYKPALKSFMKDGCAKAPMAYRLARRLHRLEKILQAAGKRLVFVVAPDKARIYPEYVGGAAPRGGCGRSFYDILLTAMERFPVEGFVRLDEALAEAKKSGPLYYRGGAHWNERGAALAAGLILEKLSTPAHTYRLPEVVYEEREVLSETSPMLAVSLYERSEFAKEIRYGRRPETIGIKARPSLPGEWILMRTRVRGRAADGLLPRTVMYRDSFMSAPLKFLKGSFREIYARWGHVFPERKGADPEEIASAGIILIEIAERDLPLLEIRLKGAEKMLNHGSLRRAGAGKNMTDGERRAVPASEGTAPREKGLGGTPASAHVKAAWSAQTRSGGS